MAVKFSNNAVTTFSASASAGATSFSVDSASTFPTLGSSDWCYVTLSGANSEVVKVTAINGATFTCDALTYSYAVDDTVGLRVSAETMEDVYEWADKIGVGSSGIDVTGTVSADGVTLGTAAGTYTAANTLDDYEEGTWTPSVYQSNNSAITGITVIGKYTKIGELIYLSFYLYKGSGATSQSGAWRIGSLPFSLDYASSGGYPAATAGYTKVNSSYGTTSSTNTRWQCNSATYLQLYGANAGISWVSGHIEFSGSGVFRVN